MHEQLWQKKLPVASCQLAEKNGTTEDTEDTEEDGDFNRKDPGTDSGLGAGGSHICQNRADVGHPDGEIMDVAAWASI